MKPVDILLTTYHRKNMTQMTLESIITRTKTPYRLIVVDNGSEPEMQDMLREYQRKGFIKVLCLLDRNWGLEYAKNTGLRFVESEPYFVNTDNDLLIESPSGGTDWLAKMIRLMDNNPKYGAISARPQCLIGVNNIFSKDKEVGQFYVCGGSYRIMRTDLVKKYKWRDEYNDSRSEEWRICGEIRRDGFETGYARDVRSFHMFGKGNWGYKDGVPHYHAYTQYAKISDDDTPFDPITCIPEREQYEPYETYEDRLEAERPKQ